LSKGFQFQTHLQQGRAYYRTMYAAAVPGH